MVNYQKGKIYKIISTHTDKCYVGSTTKDRLSNRLAHHRSDFKRGDGITSKYILELGDYEIVLLELFPCGSKDELHARERHYIEKLDCVNKQKPIRSKEEKLEYYKEYNELRKDEAKEYQKEYQLNNKDAIKEYQKEYRELNKEKQKEYYIKNKEKITCECGCLIRKPNILKHKTTKKHLDLIQSSL